MTSIQRIDAPVEPQINADQYNVSSQAQEAEPEVEFLGPYALR